MTKRCVLCLYLRCSIVKHIDSDDFNSRRRIKNCTDEIHDMENDVLRFNYKKGLFFIRASAVYSWRIVC